jgi:DNA-binding HxlR family transcriptional regulator
VRVSKSILSSYSPAFQGAAELVGSRWTGAIIYAVFHSRHRFSEIAEAVPGISDRLLDERLTALVDAEILEKQVDASNPRRPTYHLTKKGMDLRTVLIALRKWAERWEA